MYIKKNRNEILHDTYVELESEKRFTIKDNICLIGTRESKKEILIPIYNFIRDNYYHSPSFKWRYSFELFKYFIQDSIVVIFYLPGGRIGGIIIGKPIDLSYKGNYDFYSLSKVLDVNFLCVERGLRMNRICKFLINVLLKSTLEERTDINSALFTIGSHKNYNKYCQQVYYFKVLNAKVVKEANFMEFTNIEKRIDSRINKEISVEIFTNVEINKDTLQILNEKLYNNNTKRYDIFRMNKLNEIMVNPAFFKIFLTKENNIVGFIVLYQLDLEFNGRLLKNAFIYDYFVEDINLLSVLNLSLGLDLITSCIQHDYSFIKSTMVLNYYDFNLGLNEIPGSKNGLVTI